MSNKSSYKQILKSTGLIGGSQVITILFGIVSTKVISILLGPVGIGISGIYQSTIDVIRSATSLGIGFSAVRDVAEAAGTNDSKKISKTITILRRWVWLTGILGTTVTLIFCIPLSISAFGNDSYALGIAVLSLSLLFGAISAGESALLQGMRQISSIAKSNIYAVIIGLCISIPLYYLLGVSGIVPALLLSSLTSMILSLWFTRKITLDRVMVTWRSTVKDGMGMVKLGFFSVITGLFMTLTMYVVRIFISKKGGLEAVGIFMAAWKLSSMYLGMILNAMGSDYFPRLSAIHNDNKEVNKLVNEQTEIAILVAGPIIIGMISFAHIIIPILYSVKFYGAVKILQWQFIGDFLKVLSWPLGFIILAKARGGIFVATETISNFLYVCFIYFGWNIINIEITGVAFLLNYLIYLFFVYFIAVYLSGFNWSNKNLMFITIYSTLIIATFLSTYALKGVLVYLISSLTIIVSISISYGQLRSIVDLSFIKRRFKK